MNKKTTQETGAAIDLAALDTVAAADKGARVELLHPVTRQPLGIHVTIVGKHSTVFRQLVQERADKRVKEMAAADRRGKAIEPMTAEQVERNAIELLAACTLGWGSGDKPTITFEGEELAFNHANAIRLYSRLIWLREQVDNALGDLELFTLA